MHPSLARTVVAAALVALSSPAHARRVLVLADPAATTADDVLLGAAVRGSLDDEPGVTVIGPTPARALQRALREADDAAEILKGAREKFEALELEAALKDSQRAVQKLDRFNALAARMELHAAALGTLAASQLLLGQNKRARNQLEALVALRPDFTPDPSLYNPQMLETFKGIRDEVKGRKPKELRVVTLPSGAAVTIDGKLRGVAPLTVALAPGKHYVAAAMPGFEAAGHAVPLERTEVTVTLPRANQGAAQAAAAARAAAAGLEMPAEAFELAKKLKADEIVVLAKAATGFVLVRVAADRSSTKVTQDTGPAATVEQAMGVAERLLQRPYAPVAAATGASEGASAADTSAAATQGASGADTGSSSTASTSGASAEVATASSASSGTSSSDTSATEGAGAASAGATAARDTGASPADTGDAAATSAPASDAGASPEATANTTPPPTPDGVAADGWPVWAFAGYGAALLAAGGAGFTGWLAYRQRSDFRNAANQLAAEPLASKGKRYALYSDILTGTAVVAAAGTLVLQLLSGPRATASVDAGPAWHLAAQGFAVEF